MENIIYTEDQLRKIENLRATREIEKLRKYMAQEQIKRLKPTSFSLNQGDPIFITLNGKTISGYISNISSSDIYDVNTPYGLIKGIKRKNIRGRNVVNYNNVTIPEELKTKSTKSLLKILQCFRNGSWNVSNNFTEDQVRAELKNRPHIPTKGEKKIFKKYKKLNNGK
jgi:uncharacterized protein (DUF488 family)